MDDGQFISEKRKSVPTPDSLVDERGKAVFGTFDKEFARMELAKLDHPCGKAYPNFLNKLRLTLWEAAEIRLDEGTLLAAVSDMALFGVNLNLFFDRRSGKVRRWSNNLPSRKTTVAKNLLSGSVTEAKTPKSFTRFENRFEEGTAFLKGEAHSPEGDLEYEFVLKRISLPSVVSIPFGPNQPLYSQKDFFSVRGHLSLNGERFEAKESAVGIIDDHKGYYPYRMHYDWCTGLGKIRKGDREIFLAFNLTKNQTLDPDAYNENLLWLEGASSPLPPVTFETAEGGAVWKVRDEHDRVKVDFRVAPDRFAMVVHPLVIRIDYFVTFGEMSGYVRDAKGVKYAVDGLAGIGEDKTMRF